MTNEKKARELAKTLIGDDRNIEPLVDLLLQAMQWKDEQEIEFLQILLFQSATQNIFDRINDRIKLLKGE